MTELLILSVGDEKHEPHPEEMEQVYKTTEEALSEETREKYDIIILPYYITPFTTDEETLRVHDIDAEKLAELKDYLEEIEG